MSAFPCRRSAASLLVHAALASLVSIPLAASAAAPAAAASAAQAYALPAGPLPTVLAQFIAQSGVLLAGSADLAQGRQSPGLNGNYTPAAALAALLDGSGLTAIPNGDGYVLRTAAAGASADAHATMPAITITGARGVSEDSGSYTTQQLSLGKTGASLRETPHSVTVMSRQQIDDQGIYDLNDLMRATPGIEVFNTDSERVSFYARGQEITNVQFDGNGMVSPGSGNGFYIQPDTAIIDHAEVLRGAAGLMRGAGSPSGAINLVRKRPTAAMQAGFAVTGGTWDTYRAEGDLSGPIAFDGKVRGRVVAVVDQRKHFQKSRYSDKSVLYGVLEADLGPNTVATLGAQYSQLDTNGAWGNLLANRDGSPMKFARDTYLGAAWNHWDRENRQAFASVEHKFGNGWSTKASFEFLNMKRRNGADGYVQTLVSLNAKDPTRINYQVSKCGEKDYTAEQSSWDIYATGPLELWGRKHELVIGANGSRDYAQPVAGSCTTVSGLPSMQGLDPYTWNPYAIPVPVFPAFTGTYVKNLTEQQGAYASLRLHLSDNFSSIVGARVSHWESRPAVAANGYSVSAEKTPYAALLYDLGEQTSLYVSYADVFTPQLAADVTGRRLKPITGRNIEAGWKGEFFDKKLNANLSVYQLEQEGKAIDDLSSPFPCLPDYPSGYCQTDAGKQRARGFEAELSGQLQPGWQMSGGYTFTTTRYLRDSATNTGQALRTTTPKHLLRVFTQYTLPGELKAWAVGGGVNVQSEIVSRSATAYARQGGYGLLTAHASYRISPNLQAQLNVNNLLDRVYYEKVRESGPGYYYGPPRSIMLTLRGRY